MEQRRGTRWEILQLLKHHPGQTVSDLSDTVGITAAAVRKHLISLEMADVIDSDQERRPMGRPARRYRLTPGSEEWFPHNYHELATGLLDYLRRTNGPDGVAAFFEERSSRVRREVGPLMDDLDITGKVRVLTEYVNKEGFMAEFRVEDGHIIVDQFNCTLAQVVRVYPDICMFEQQLFQDLLGVPVRRVKHLGSNEACCSYIIPIEAIN